MKRQITIGTKITLVTGGLCAAIILIGAVSIYNLGSLNQITWQIINDPTAGTSGAHRG